MSSATFLPAEAFTDVPGHVRPDDTLTGSALRRRDPASGTSDDAGPRARLSAVVVRGLEQRPGTGDRPPRLRRRPVPVREPRALRTVDEPDEALSVPPTQGTFALTFAAPAPTSAGSLHDGPEPVSAEDQDWAVRFALAAVEVALGIRSAAQLVRWTSLDVHALLTRRGALAARARGSGPHRATASAVRALRLCAPRPGIQEVTAVVVSSDRIRAVAFRMESGSGRWRVTALEIG